MISLKNDSNMVDKLRLTVAAVPLPILWVVNAVIVIDGGLLLDDLAPGAGAGHGRAEEDVDEQHDGEEDPEGDAQPQEPLVRDAAERRRAVVHGSCEEHKCDFLF